MIPPNLVTIEWTLAAIPIWRWQPVDPTRCDAGATQPPDASTGSQVADEMRADETAPEMRLVFRGYEWRPIALWTCIANPDWDRWSEGRHDDAAQRAREQERRRIAPTMPPTLPEAPPR
jgi:hypothetical protein